jgi:hypothetical protein
VFAGAVRETVLSDPHIINRLKNEFVTVAIRAMDLNSPSNDSEGQLIRTIAQSKVAPQGLCVTNKSGQALAWSETFRDGQSVEAFLDRTLQLFKANRNGAEASRTERYMTFPDNRLDDAQVEPRVAECTTILQSATVPHRTTDGMVVRLIGRALDQHGQFLSDTLQQEHYVEHKIELPLFVQQQLLRDLAANGNNKFALSEPMSAWMMKEAFLGQLDMQPMRDTERAAVTKVQNCKLYAQRTGKNSLDITGDTEISVSNEGRTGDGAAYSNYIKLRWQGAVEFDESNVNRILLLGRGIEKANWAQGPPAAPANAGACPSRDNLLKSLMAGHQFNLDCPVVFGFEGTTAK